MDYYQGVTEFCETKTEELSEMRTEDSQLRIDILSSEQADIYEQLKVNIGQKQSLVFFIKETYPINNEVEKEILFENGMDYVSLEAMLPADRNELRKSGYARMEDIDFEVLLKQPRATYSVDNAVDYMTQYTSNPSSCNVCGTGCSSKVDTTKYNSSYSHYVTKGNHVDCANYVSQALSAGGISTDSTWKAGTSAWIGVSKLTDYMTSNKHWASVTYDKVKKGDVVSYTSFSHVVMITSFDGTTYKYSGHTNDRKNATISIKSSTASSYNFYRVS